MSALYFHSEQLMASRINVVKSPYISSSRERFIGVHTHTHIHIYIYIYRRNKSYMSHELMLSSQDFKRFLRTDPR